MNDSDDKSDNKKISTTAKSSSKRKVTTAVSKVSEEKKPAAPVSQKTRPKSGSKAKSEATKQAVEKPAEANKKKKVVAKPKPLAKNTPADDGIIASIENDNLQIIEGIGPAMEKVLHENGITTWKALGQHSIADVKGILDKYGDKYKIINPASWIDQAKMAADGDVEGIIQMQKDDGSISKLEKLLKPATKIKKQVPTKKQAPAKKQASTKKQSKLQAVTTDTPLDQTIDLNSPHLPTHPERIWPD